MVTNGFASLMGGSLCRDKATNVIALEIFETSSTLPLTTAANANPEGGCLTNGWATLMRIKSMTCRHRASLLGSPTQTV